MAALMATPFTWAALAITKAMLQPTSLPALVLAALMMTKATQQS